MAESALLRVRLTPKGGRDALIRREGKVLFARVAAPPVDGAANRALIALLAESLDVAKSRIALLSGQTGRDKILRIDGLDASALEERLQKALKLIRKEG
jgi:uncharacterized protein (TIGR00251 family)